MALGGVEPPSERYECSVLTVELQSLVAGARIARASRGYEPREVLLLYPAGKLYHGYARNSTNLFLV